MVRVLGNEVPSGLGCVEERDGNVHTPAKVTGAECSWPRRVVRRLKDKVRGVGIVNIQCARASGNG